jgi:hypothetical protein
MKQQEEQFSQAGYAVQLCIDDEKEEYNVFISSNTKRTHLGFDNMKDARKCYEVLEKLDGMNPCCKWCNEMQENAPGGTDTTSFLHGMYYSGKLPSRAECREISQYLRSSGLINGKQTEIEKQLAEAITELHQALSSEDKKEQ